MSMEKELNDVIAKIEADMSGFIAASVVDLESGMTLAANSTSPSPARTTASW